jgi:hypothetical protein
LIQANEQVIEIPPRIVLLRVIEAIGAKVAPIFTCTQYGSVQFKMCVELDVSDASISVGKPPQVAKVEGEICVSPALAETSAITNAFKYLARRHCIQVLDYSSSIIQMFELDYALDDVYNLDYLITNMIEQWDLSLKQCDEFAQQLEYKEILDNNDNVISEAGKVYATLDDFIIYIIKRYRSIPVDASSEWDKNQDERLRYIENLTKIHHKFLRKVSALHVHL